MSDRVVDDSDATPSPWFCPHCEMWIGKKLGDILRAVNGAASLHRGNPAGCRSVSGLALPRSAGRVSTLARERPMALSRGLPSTGKSLPRGFSTRLSPRRSCLAAPVPAPVTPFDRALGAPSPWVVDGPTPAVTSHRESAEPVCELSAWSILSVGVPVWQSPVSGDTKLTRFTPAVNGGILSLNQDSCLDGHARPRLPLYYDDVDFDDSWRVTQRDRVRAKLRRLIGR